MFHSPIPFESARTAAVLRPADRVRAAAVDPDLRVRADGVVRIARWHGLLSVAGLLAVLAAGPRTPLLFGWGAALLVAALAGLRRTRRTDRRAIVEAGCHAGLWAVLPTLAGPAVGMPAIVTAIMMAGAVLCAAVPAAALLWILLPGIGLAAALAATPVQPALLVLPVYATLLLVGCRTLQRRVAAWRSVAIVERAAHESIALLLKEYEDQGVGWLWQTDAADRLVYVSPRICVLLGRSTSQLIGHSIVAVLGGDARLDHAIAIRQPFGDLAVEVPTPGGARWVSLAGSPVVDPAGHHHGFRGVGTDITEIRHSQDRLTQLASIDMLTGLPNRQRLREIFGDAIADSRRTGHPCAILFLDLDGFKPVNDTFGHSIGDAVLRIVARRLDAEVGTAGLVGRVGGDEFALLIHDGREPEQVAALAGRLIAAIAEPFLFDKGEIRIGLSIGCAFAPSDGVSIDDLLLKADLALYDAKSQGRGTLRLFHPRMQQVAEARAELERDLRLALDRDQLRIAYQPIVAAASGAVLGFEALLRWDHPERGPIAPADFIPIAEETRLIDRIGAWVIAQACRDAACWPDQMVVTVNLSPRQLLDPMLPHAVGEALAAARLQPNRLELEVTEAVLIGDSAAPRDVLRRLRALGIGIALDDFGTGRSSLASLDNRIFDTLKIDGSLVRDAAVRSETHAIIGAIVGLANGFHFQITAEGIETQDDLVRMRDFGCHRLQGWLFGQPMGHDGTLALTGIA